MTLFGSISLCLNMYFFLSKSRTQFLLKCLSDKTTLESNDKGLIVVLIRLAKVHAKKKGWILDYINSLWNKSSKAYVFGKFSLMNNIL